MARAAAQPVTEGFINPYNFVPFAGPPSENPEGLRPGLPPGHGRYQPDRYCGSIDITITSETPLLIMDQARSAWDVETKHATLAVRRDSEGLPLLAASSVRGMLRSAFETITNSRMGAFSGESYQAIRELPEAALRKKPAIVVNGGKTLNVVMSLKPTTVAEQPLPAVLVPSAQVTRMKDRDEVVAWAYLVQHANPAYTAWRTATVIAAREEQPPQPADAGATAGSYRLCCGAPVAILVKGFLIKTGRTFQTRNKSKHDEHLVVTEVLSGPAKLSSTLIAIDATIKGMWDGVLAAYRDAEKAKIPVPGNVDRGPYAKPDPGKHWALSDHRGIYVELRNGKVVGISPTLIGRKPFPKKPRDLVPPELLPSTELAKLSAADRVFGWVALAGKAARHGAYRGNLRIEPPKVNEQGAIQPFTQPITLAPLQSPKPSQYRFYVRNSNGTPVDREPKDTDGGYASSNKLAGRKVYPHHRGLPEHYWNGCPARSGERVREYLAVAGPNGHKPSQTRSIVDWVKPKVTFSTVIHFDNLNGHELGALLHLLTLPPETFHRIGLGKPLGFGSVRVQADLDRARVGSAAHLSAGYRELSPRSAWLARDELDKILAAFEESQDRTGGALNAWEASARGFTHPIHYPRTTSQAQQPEGFRWFVQNEQGIKRNGRKQSGRKLPLPLLGAAGPPLLPYSPVNDQ